MQPVFYKTQWHFNERFIGMLMALNGVLITVIEMALIYNLEGKWHPLKYIASGMLVTALGFIVVNLFPPAKWVAVVAILMVTIGEILSMPFMNAFWVERTTPGNRGQYAALYTMAWSSSQILAPAMGSRVVLYSNYSTLWWLVGGICALCALGFLWLYAVSNSKTVQVHS